MKPWNNVSFRHVRTKPFDPQIVANSSTETGAGTEGDTIYYLCMHNCRLSQFTKGEWFIPITVQLGAKLTLFARSLILLILIISEPHNETQNDYRSYLNLASMRFQFWPIW